MAKIKLEVGMRMKCATYGEGRITALHPYYYRGIVLRIGECYYKYFNDGRYHNGTLPTLKLLNTAFTEGLEVECCIYGEGTVCGVSESQVNVFFASGALQPYTLDGCIGQYANQTLFPKFTV